MWSDREAYEHNDDRDSDKEEEAAVEMDGGWRTRDGGLYSDKEPS